MSAILEKARAHFANMQRRVIEIPEWGDDDGPAKVYAPALTMADRQKIERRSKDDPVARLINTIIHAAQNEDGTRMFSDDAVTRRAFEREIEPRIVARLATAILNVSDEADLGA